jgi:hypothetical protein
VANPYIITRLGTNLLVLHYIAYLYWNALQDVILLQSLVELRESGHLDNASFVLQRISIPFSLATALNIVFGYQNRAHPTNYMLNYIDVADYFGAPLFALEDPEPFSLYAVCSHLVSSFVSNRVIAF